MTDDTDERIAALARELAACRLALLNTQTERDAAQAEAAELRDARVVAMADALQYAWTTTKVAMLP